MLPVSVPLQLSQAFVGYLTHFVPDHHHFLFISHLFLRQPDRGSLFAHRHHLPSLASEFLNLLQTTVTRADEDRSRKHLLLYGVQQRIGCLEASQPPLSKTGIREADHVPGIPKEQSAVLSTSLPMLAQPLRNSNIDSCYYPCGWNSLVGVFASSPNDP